MSVCVRARVCVYVCVDLCIDSVVFGFYFSFGTSGDLVFLCNECPLVPVLSGV